MSVLDDQVTVLYLACLTEDRDAKEQRAMLNVALALDTDRGSFALGNFRGGRCPVPPTLVELVRETYQHTEGRRIDLTRQQQGAYDRLMDKWALCAACDTPRGMHPPDHCLTHPTPIEAEHLARVRAAIRPEAPPTNGDA